LRLQLICRALFHDEKSLAQSIKDFVVVVVVVVLCRFFHSRGNNVIIEQTWYDETLIFLKEQVSQCDHAILIRRYYVFIRVNPILSEMRECVSFTI